MDLIPFSISEYSLETYLIRISSRSRIIYWIIILMVVSGIAVLPVIKLDVSIQARGYFQTDIEKQIVFASVQGKVIFIAVKNGQKVTRGDTLLIIDAESKRLQYASLLHKIEENNASIEDLEKVVGIKSINDPELITPRYRAEYNNYQSKLAIQFEKYQKKKTEHTRNELLFNQQLLAKSDYENSLFLMESEKDNLLQLKLAQKAQWQSDLTIRKNESTSLLADLKQCSEEIRDHILLAPTSGEIIQCTDIQTGSYVSSGQRIIEISPEGILLATCFVKPSDVGFIHKKQKVKIQVDAFNHNEWGMLNGEIVDISDDMIVENGSAYFRIKCKPERTILTLKNGYNAEVRKGMSLNTRIFVIRRSLFQLLIDKADKWFNPYTYNKK